MMDFSIIIPTWNAKHLLEKNLPKVIDSLEKNSEIIVVDNGSNDGSKDYLGQHFSLSSQVRIISLEKNYGFAYACNLGVREARAKIVILLNNDVIPERDFLKPLKKDFSNQNVFAVSLHEPQYSWAKGEFKAGFLSHQPGAKTTKVHFSLWASGGSGAFRRSYWLNLGGFDLIFHPFYWEDVDLSYRAWKRGFQTLWEPNSIVHHQHEASVNRFSKGYVDLIKERNELMFIWKNITSRGMIKEHKKFLLERLMKNPGYTKACFLAVLKLPSIWKQREKEKKESKLTDEQVFKQLL